jgi:TfoX/Sxy family transcriptional regulator of competence genes
VTIASDALTKRLRPLLMKRPGMVEKKMFGGTGFMLHGNMALGTTASGDLLVRIDPAKQSTALSRAGAFQMMMGEREMKGFIAVRAEGTTDPDDLRAWIADALDYARTLPPK